MDADILKILLSQFGVDPAVVDRFIAGAVSARQKIDGFDARLKAIEDILGRIESALIPPRGANPPGVHNAKH